MARIDTLGHFLTDVADAIRTKTGSSDTIAAEDFDTEIENIPSGSDLSKYFNLEPATIPSTNKWGVKELLKDISDIELIIPSSVTSLSSMFSGYTYKYVPKIVASNITTMLNMFNQASNLIKVDLSSVDMSKITDLGGMFYACTNLVEINLSSFKPTTTGTISFTNTFSSCTSLTEIDFSAPLNRFSANFYNTFAGCSHLEKLDLRGINLTSSRNMTEGVFTSVPDDCLIIVYDNDDKTALLSVVSRFTNVKTVEEYEAEQNQ